MLEEEGIIVYPNPSKRDFSIGYTALAEGEIQVTVVDLNGKEILSHKDIAINTKEQKQLHIDLQNLSGVYVLNILFENGKSYTTKLIKEN